MDRKRQDKDVEELLEQALVPEDKWPYKVPDNWVWVRLGTLVYSRMEKCDEFKDEDIKYISLEHIQKDNGIIGYGKALGVKSLKNVFHSSDILYGKLRPYLNKHDLAPFGGVCSTDILVFRISELTINSFVNYLLNTDRLIEHAVKNSKGINLPRVSEQELLEFYSPLPPLPEQHRIVERVENLFEKLNQAKGLIQDALNSFENRKSSILHKAFSGELTKKWREENGVGMDSWEETSFDKFCRLKRGFDLPSKDRIAGVFPLVSSSGIVDTHNEGKVKGPGIVTGRSGTIGKVYFINGDYWPLNTTLYSEKIYENFPKYIYYYLCQFDFKQYSSSTAVPTLNRNNFSDVSVFKPTIDEQKEIVRILETVLENEQKAGVLCDLIENIDYMKKAILARDFRGELGTNNPSEESALELLKEVLTR